MERRFEQSLALPADTVFAFFANPNNLSLLMADWPNFRLLAHPAQISLGSTVWFEITLAGCVPVVCGFRQTLYEPPDRFGAELIHGPFQTFQHIHEFQATTQGTVVKELLRIRLSWVHGGEFTERWIVTRMIDEAFAIRRCAIERLMTDGTLAGRAVHKP